MVRRSACSSFVAALLLALPLAAQEPDDRPNILVIVTDDQGWGDIGYHNPNVYSPNLDALAASGTRFTQHYVMPQCTPTRVAVLTGRYPSRFGPQAQQASNAPAFPLGTATMATMLRAVGYETWLVGKWHLGTSVEHGPTKFGFDHSYGSLAGAIGMYDHRYRAGRFAENWHRDDVVIPGWENGTHATDLVAREAVRVIERRREGPFFLYLAFHAVHTPLDERGRFVDRPTQLDPERPGRWLDEDEIAWFHDPEGIIQRERDPEKRLLLAAVHHLDHAVGQVVDALERSGQRDDTLILFTSDNGPQGSWPGNAYPDDLRLTDFNQPIPMRGKKTDTYEGGIHVPGFAVWPGRVPAREVDVPVHCVDWLPTLAKVVGAPAPEATDGEDLSPLLFGAEEVPEGLRRRELYWVWSAASNRRALRFGDWKIVRYGKREPEKPGDWQLFHLGEDPREQRDVAAAHPEVLDDLHRRYLEQRARDKWRKRGAR
ncbi:MAG: sulfatase-like hydrolase/transferase [Planctomycetes bacterium]|nr:sulfatase-like hydrolase/transferase [Planctomycetota bacterium]